MLARIISFVLHPLLMATYMFLLFAYTFPLAFDPIKENNIWNFIFLIFCVTFIIPVLNVALFKTTGTIRSLAMETRRERIIPFIFISALYCGVTWFLYLKAPVALNDNFVRFMMVVDALVVVSTLITFFYKVSVHSLAIWGLLGILLPLNNVVETGAMFYPTVGVVVLAGLVMSARLQLNAHTPREVLVGATTGLATSLVAMRWLF